MNRLFQYKRIFFPLLFVVLFSFFLSFCIESRLRDGFSQKHIYSHRKEFQNVKKGDASIIPILSQNFFYKEKGSQFYVFESQDGQYILKFFRFQRYKKKKRELEELITSCVIAKDELENETQLVALHLNKTSELQLQIKCFDRLGRSFLVEMDQVEFVLQKKGKLLYPYLKELLANNQKEEAKKALCDLVHILKSRMEKGIFDNDSSISKNAGFYQGKAMFIDIGQFKKESKFQEKDLAKAEIQKITAELVIWLKTQDADLALFLNELTSKEIL